MILEASDFLDEQKYAHDNRLYQITELVSHIQATENFLRFKWNLHIFYISLKLKCLYNLSSTYALPRIKNSSHFLEEELFKGKIPKNTEIDLDTC